jgi:heme-degrading monooxygenase HmoA
MKVRVHQVEGGPGDGGASFLRDRVQPMLRSLDGCEGIVGLTADGGRGVSMTLWRDEQAMQATEDQAASLRAEAEQQGYRVSVLGRFSVEVLELRGGDPQAARFVRWSGSGDVKALVNDKVSPAYGPLDGFCGLFVGSGEGEGFGVSLWTGRTAIDNARDTTSQLPGWLSEAGFSLDSVEACDVAVCDVRQGAHA